MKEEELNLGTELDIQDLANTKSRFLGFRLCRVSDKDSVAKRKYLTIYRYKYIYLYIFMYVYNFDICLYGKNIS